jgi:hypothetical protein
MDNDAKQKRIKLLQMFFELNIKISFVDIPEEFNSIDDCDTLKATEIIKYNLKEYTSSNKLKILLESKG